MINIQSKESGVTIEIKGTGEEITAEVIGGCKWCMRVSQKGIRIHCGYVYKTSY